MNDMSNRRMLCACACVLLPAWLSRCNDKTADTAVRVEEEWGIPDENKTSTNRHRLTAASFFFDSASKRIPEILLSPLNLWKLHGFNPFIRNSQEQWKPLSHRRKHEKELWSLQTVYLFHFGFFFFKVKAKTPQFKSCSLGRLSPDWLKHKKESRRDENVEELQRSTATAPSLNLPSGAPSQRLQTHHGFGQTENMCCEK